MYEYYPTFTMTYLTYSERNRWRNCYLQHLRQILVREYNLDPDQTLNIASPKPLTCGSSWTQSASGTINRSTYPSERHTGNVFRIRASLVTIFKDMPEKLKTAIRKQQKILFSNPRWYISPKMARYRTHDSRYGYCAPMIERGSYVPAGNIYIETLSPEDEITEHQKEWQTDQEYPLSKLSVADYNNLHTVALTSLALHLTRLQLLTQCMPTRN